ncbi:hypothetical protein RI367_004213 [Sorochytrium milnesiophthora]
MSQPPPPNSVTHRTPHTLREDKLDAELSLARAAHVIKSTSDTATTSTTAQPVVRRALHSHVSFFDRNKDGIIYPWETYQGFRALGFNIPIAVTSALAFHVLHVSYPTQDSWVPRDPFLSVIVRNAHRAKHGSDTESFDTSGDFRSDKFDEIFARYDVERKGGLVPRDIVRMIGGNRNVGDLLGIAFQVFLWSYLWMLAADPVTGILSKETARKQYDGSLFYELEARQKSGNKLPWWRGGELW